MKLVFGFFVDALVFVTLALGMYWGCQSLLNIGRFMGWFVGVLLILTFANKDVVKSAEKKYQHQHFAIRVYDVVTDLLFVMVCAYQGWMFLAAVYALAAMMKTEFKNRMEKQLCQK